MTERAGAEQQVSAILTNPDQASLKRVAWAYGCAKKDSEEERQLRDILILKAKQEHHRAILAQSYGLPEPKLPSVACEICQQQVPTFQEHFSTDKGRPDGFWRCHPSVGKVRCAKCDHTWKPHTVRIPARCASCGETDDLFWADDGGWERAAMEKRSRDSIDYNE